MKMVIPIRGQVLIALSPPTHYPRQSWQTYEKLLFISL